MRRRLQAYFARKRVACADDLVDETFNRLARRLADEGRLDAGPPARYCYITARFVFLEHLRQPEVVALPDRDAAGPAATATAAEGDERRLDCLDKCLGELKEADRHLILEYYSGEQRVKIAHRQQLAARLGISANALTIRASRIRTRLEACVSSCCGQR
jgi:DNA-directed RNA polymerase specialized sigma24 family protein